ncbi:MAG: DNA-binding protein [Leptolyngbyaceae cyanobacterium]
MNEWFSPKELEGKPGIPSTRRNISEMAKREGWKARKRSGRGGGWEYHVSSLPAETQKALGFDAEAIDRPVDQAPPAVDATPGTTNAALTVPGQLADLEGFRGFPSRSVSSSLTAIPRDRGDLGPQGTKAERRAAAKLWILEHFEAWCESQGVTKAHECKVAWCRAYAAQTLDIPDWVYASVKCGSHQTLHNWMTKLKSGSPTALYGAGGQNKDAYAIERNPLLSKFCVAVLGEFPHIGTKHLCRAIESRFENLQLPSYPSVCRWLNWWKERNKATYTYLHNPDEWRNKYASKIGSYSEGIVEPNQRWELDSTIGDIMLRGDDGRMKRHAIVSCVDVFTRRCRMLVSPTSKATAIVALLRRCILEWGIPTQIKTDNGSDYKSHHLKHVVMALGIDQVFCTPYTPQQKPHVERFFHTFSHDLLELEPEFVGHNVTERKALEAKKSWADRFGTRGQTAEILRSPHELQLFCDDYCVRIYGTRQHSMTGLAPEMAAAGFEKRVVPDANLLDLLMLPGGKATVTAQGIRKHNHYYVPLAATIAEPLVGRTVHVRFPDNLGALYIYEDATCREFLGVAECPELLGKSRQAMAIESKAFDAYTKRAAKAAKDLGRELNVKNIGAEIRQSLLEASKTLEVLPQGSTAVPSKSFEAAQSLQAALLPREIPTETAEMAEAKQRLRDEDARREEQEFQRLWARDPAGQYSICWKKLFYGKSVTTDELAEMARYRRTPSGRNRAKELAGDYPVMPDPLPSLEEDAAAM